MRGWLRCYCGYLIEVDGYVVECPRCGRKFLYKLRSGKFVLKEERHGKSVSTK